MTDATAGYIPAKRSRRYSDLLRIQTWRFYWHYRPYTKNPVLNAILLILAIVTVEFIVVIVAFRLNAELRLAEMFFVAAFFGYLVIRRYSRCIQLKSRSQHQHDR